MTTLELPASGEASRRQLPQWMRLICVLFFVSGFPALIYQLTWQRALFRIFGVNVESVTIVVTAFMLGLGLGSLAGGLLSKHRDIPLLPLLAAIELATAAFGSISLDIFDRVGAFTSAWPLAAMAAVALALVIVPTLLMGATLPLLVSHLVRRSCNVGGAVGRLYYVNTLGAGAACLLCMLLLFPFFGMHGTIGVAVSMNVAVAFGALVMHRRERRQHVPHLPTGEASAGLAEPTSAILPVLVLAAAGGFVSLSYEIFFFRAVSYASGSSATAFAATLSAFLVGLASGSRGAGRDCETLTRAQAMERAVRRLIAANLLGLLFLPFLDQLAWLDRGVVGVAVLMVYLVARCWGSLLPYLAEIGVAAGDRVGMQTAHLYLANILGAALGSILTGFVLMDHLGLVAIAVTLVGLGVLCAVLQLAVNIMTAERRREYVLAAASVGALALFAIPLGAADVLEHLQWKGMPGGKPLLQVVENRSGIITVDTDGRVFGHGMYDGQFNTDLKKDTNGIVRPYALSLFHPAPRDVLMIGLSSGSWAQVIAANPNVASLTVVEINPGYLELIARSPEVASVLNNPKLHIVIDDGRRWLRQHPDRRFDVVVSNTTWHFRANVANLLSEEFLGLVRARLSPGGAFFYNTTDSARAQRTGCLAFAHGARFTNHMVVSMSPLDWSFSRWRSILEAYRIDGQQVFAPFREEDRLALDRLMTMEGSLAASGAVSRPIESCPDILARTIGKRPVTDDNMGSEWRYFLGLE